MSYHRSEGEGLDQSTDWSEWRWDSTGRSYRTRTGPTGVQEYSYYYSEAEQQSATPRSPGPVGFNYANNPQPTYSPPTTTSTNAYTTSQAYNYGAIAQDTTATPSYASPATIQNYYTVSNTTDRGYGTVPNLYNPNTAWSLSNSYPPAGNMATSSIEATTHGYKEHAGLEQNEFWKVGRVFMMVWTEPARQSTVPGNGAASNGSQLSRGSQYFSTYLGAWAYSEIRRFVVVRKNHGSSICCSIHTYSGQATLKPNLPAANLHTIIYTSPTCPDQHRLMVNGQCVEEQLTKDPIHVIREREDDEGHLNRLSRLNYSKVYTVEHHALVLNIGMVASSSMSSLLKDSRPPAPAGQSSSHHNKHHRFRRSHRDGHH
ncbi:hypothetical protein EYC84_002006 [Monilinia fructicola]|uniref:DUF6590 domain-containing protein n=1 Tax=Monilinia fructicola TaxID=38448 RepID=A0A5M9JS44_MONFR|nr:hypothetical protein EYC84_002006 [Monilinia fructicola]